MNKKAKATTKTLLMPLGTALVYVVAFVLSPQTVAGAFDLVKAFLFEMIQVLPPVLLLSGLIAVWVPRDIITRGFGQGSGWRGRFFSLLLGSVSAGPIYAAFPLCLTLHKKGASVENLVIILSSWAVIKVPMLIMEIRFLGLEFSLLRYVLTVPTIFFMAWLIQKIIGSRALELPLPVGARDTQLAAIEQQLPGYNCKACGYADCRSFARGVQAGTAVIAGCRFATAPKPVGG